MHLSSLEWSLVGTRLTVNRDDDNDEGLSVLPDLSIAGTVELRARRLHPLPIRDANTLPPSLSEISFRRRPSIVEVAEEVAKHPSRPIGQSPVVLRHPSTHQTRSFLLVI